MKKALALLALCAVTGAFAQTQVLITNVSVSEKSGESTGNGTTIQLNSDEGSDRGIIYQQGDLRAKVWCKVSTHNVRRSSLKDSAVNLIFEIDLDAGKDHDNKRVEKIFYMDQTRTTTVTQKFNFKQGINMRVVTLKFDAEIK